MDILTVILSIIKGGLTLANRVAAYLENERKIQAGIDKQVRENLEKAVEDVSKAIDARRDARRKFERDGMPKDYKYFRD